MKKIFLTLLLIAPLNIYSNNLYLTESYDKDIKVKSWKEIHDLNITKQNLDFSCGAASIATLLNGYYNQKISEQDILKIIDKGDFMASFNDMQKAIIQLGFESKGYAISIKSLKALKVPVIAYIKHRKSDHFTVISGVNENFIRISDPSLGQRTLSIEQFQKMWEIRDDEELKGKILTITSPHKPNNTKFFTRDVDQPTKQSIKQLSNQY